MKKLLALVLGVGLSLSAFADDNMSFEQTKKLAESGDLNGQLSLAQDFYDKQDYINAFKWFTNASKQGSAEANYKLAWMYFGGKGVTEDNTKFLEFLTKSANQNYTVAQFQLGLNYENGNYINGKIVNQDYLKAKKWYEKASQQGYAEATFGIARLYFNGWGIPKDIEKAIYYTKKSAEEGDAIAQYSLAKAYEIGDNVPKSYEKAANWYQKSSEQNFFKAQYRLGKMYEEGKGIPTNLSLAKIWYEKACEQDEADSCELSKQLKQKGY